MVGLAARSPDADGSYATLYRFATEFRPDEVGCDEMGALAHVHVEAREVRLVTTSGLTALWPERSGTESRAAGQGDDATDTAPLG